MVAIAAEEALRAVVTVRALPVEFARAVPAAETVSVAALRPGAVALAALIAVKPVFAGRAIADRDDHAGERQLGGVAVLRCRGNSPADGMAKPAVVVVVICQL